MEGTRKQYKLYLAAVKIFACFLVIVNHTNSTIFLSSTPSVTWFLSVTYFFISKPAVPLFVLVSGVTLFQREVTYPITWKRFFRMLIVLFVVSLMYYVLFRRYRTASLLQFLLNLPNQPATGALWYLYLYLGILLLQPIMYKLCRAMSGKDVLYLFCAVSLFSGIVPILSHYFPSFALRADFLDAFFHMSIVLLPVGYAIDRQAFAWRREKMLTCLLAGYIVLLACQVILTYHEYLANSESYLFLDDRWFFTISMSAVILFLGAKLVFESVRLPKKVENEIETVSKSTFCIYLLGDLLISRLNFIRTYLSGFIHPLAAVICLQLCVFLAGFVITHWLRKVPLIARYI